jgi:DNA polymerase IV (DinB-like DNA polymerase)
LPARVIMLVDLDYFFAQCEEVLNPALKDKPVVVCVYSGRSEDSGAVSTANYLARKYGVKSGISIYLAKRKLEGTEAVFLPVNYEFYEQISGKIMEILRAYCHRFEQVGIDEAYLDVSQEVGGDFDKARDLAIRIKEVIRAQQKITCSIGVGPNKLIAKIAADDKKPDGLTIIKPAEVRNFLYPMPVGRLIGVGKKTEKKMETLGIDRIGDLAGYDVQRLIGVFGKTLGIYFHNASQGIDDTTVQETGEAESISRISTLKEDTRDLEIILEKANRLCDEIQAGLVKKRLSFKQVGIVAIMKDLSIHSRTKTLEKPTDDLETLKRTAKDLFEKFLQESSLEIRRVGVRVSSLIKEQNKQKQLTSFIVNT